MKPTWKCWFIRWRGLYTIFFTIFLLVFLVHFLLLPSVSGSYNNPCYMDPKEMEDLRYLLRSVILALQKHNITYWLDYGTLLGAVRYGDVIPWDGDGDISILKQDDSRFGLVSTDLRRLSIRANPMIATYKNSRIDIMRWRTAVGKFNGISQPLLYKYYPSWSEDNFIIRMQHKIDTFPLAWVHPRKLVKFVNIKAHAVHETNKLLQGRYSFTLPFNFPYKWKCWLPM